MEQLRQQNAQAKKIKIILGAENSLSGLEKKMKNNLMLKKIKKIEDNIIKNARNKKQCN